MKCISESLAINIDDIMYHSHFFYSPPENLTYQEAIMFFVVLPYIQYVFTYVKLDAANGFICRMINVKNSLYFLLSKFDPDLSHFV